MRVGLLSVTLMASAALAQDKALVQRYCVGCHNAKALTGGLALDVLDVAHPEAHAEMWEKVVRKVRAGMMPPAGMARPSKAELDGFAGRIEASLDRAAKLKPNPGYTPLHRLNRTEYANAIHDLLTLDIDVATLLPADDSSEGFDNIADALSISPALVDRYTSAAVKIAKLATGNLLASAETSTYRVPGDLSQTAHLDGFPLGTRGGLLVKHNFPLDAEYSLKIRGRAAGGIVGGPGASGEELELTLDGERIKVSGGAAIDLKIPIKAGPRTITAAFVRKTPPGADEMWKIYGAASGVTSIAITGPLNATSPGDTPARRRLFICKPTVVAEEAACAKKIISNVARQAYRRPLVGADLDKLLTFYSAGRAAGSFDDGIEQALARVLVDPQFIFRFEEDPANVAPGVPYAVTDLELASRLSFFLWSSLPDNELITVAAAGKLHLPAVLEQQTRRMLADERSSALVTNFGAQWLYLRELKSAKPDAPDFNDNLRQAFRRETEMLLECILREDRSVVDLLSADYTFVDERLAAHYGIPNVRGSRFRKVMLTDENRRGLLGQGSFLLVTSVSNRTSPVARGKWILENLLGTAPPLPPPNVPALTEDASGKLPVSVRERMEQHRSNPVCASCHKIMDPIGFSLENYDLTGKWRATEGTTPINAAGQLVDGTPLNGPASLRQALLARSDLFVETLAAKLLTYGTGRALKYYDMPAVREITRSAAKNNNRFSSLILGVVTSAPFRMKMKPEPAVQQTAAAAGSTAGGRP